MPNQLYTFNKIIRIKVIPKLLSKYGEKLDFYQQSNFYRINININPNLDYWIGVDITEYNNLNSKFDTSIAIYTISKHTGAIENFQESHKFISNSAIKTSEFILTYIENYIKLITKE
jgi:hypothetical protein